MEESGSQHLLSVVIGAYVVRDGSNANNIEAWVFFFGTETVMSSTFVVKAKE